MELEVTRIDIPESVLELGKALNGPIGELHEAAAHYLADAYRNYVVAVGAVDTGELLGSIHVEDGFSPLFGERSKFVVASALHSSVVEYGWIDRGQGQASYPGRYPARSAIQFFIENLVSGGLANTLNWRLGNPLLK